MFNFKPYQAVTPTKNSTTSSKNSIAKYYAMYSVAGYNIPIIKSARRKSIAVKLRKTEIVIEVPKYLSKIRIQDALEKHQSWVLKQVNQHKQIEQALFNGLPGEHFEFLGQSYYCHWSDEAPDNSRKLSTYNVCHDSKCLFMNFKKGLSHPKRQQLSMQAVERFFKTQAKSYLQSKVDEFAHKMQLDYHSITVKTYKSRWGSCYPDGRIQFNWRLMQAPSQVVDYVVVHELAHRTHANHSSAFWGLVAKHYPATATAKKELKLHGSRWIQLLQN